MEKVIERSPSMKLCTTYLNIYLILVFSFGEGEDGKLGHGNRITLDKPKMIESLRNKRIRDIACGSSHSAVKDKKMK